MSAAGAAGCAGTLTEVFSIAILDCCGLVAEGIFSVFPTCRAFGREMPL